MKSKYKDIRDINLFSFFLKKGFIHVSMVKTNFHILGPIIYFSFDNTL